MFSEVEDNPLQLSKLTSKQRTSSLISGSRAATKEAAVKFPIVFSHLGRHGYELTLYAPTFIAHKKWIEYINKQKKVLDAKADVYTQRVVIGHFFYSSNNRVNCVAPLDGGRKLLYGSGRGIYLSEIKNSVAVQNPELVIEIAGSVQQLDVIEEYGILLGLVDKTLYSWPLECLETEFEDSESSGELSKLPTGTRQNNSCSNRSLGKRIFGPIKFYKVGLCLGRILVVTVKSGGSNTTIVRVLEPVDPNGIFNENLSSPGSGLGSGSLNKSKRVQPALRKLLASGGAGNNSSTSHNSIDLKVFKELVINSDVKSVSFLTNKLCVGTSKGFEIVSLEGPVLEVQPLLDPADTSLDFILNHHNSSGNGYSSSGYNSSSSSNNLSALVNGSDGSQPSYSASPQSLLPMTIYRLYNTKDFLLNYSDFSFFVNRHGWRSRSNWFINWAGVPRGFALSYPYLLGFDDRFIEIRDIETSELLTTISGNGIKKVRFLHENTREIIYVYEDVHGFEVVVSLDFWDKKKTTSMLTNAESTSNGTAAVPSTKPANLASSKNLSS